MYPYALMIIATFFSNAPPRLEVVPKIVRYEACENAKHDPQFAPQSTYGRTVENYLITCQGMSEEDVAEMKPN